MHWPLSPQVEAAFAATLEVAEPERQAFLAREYGGNPELRAEVESLLQAYGAIGSFLEGAPAIRLETMAGGPVELPSGLGRYRIVRVLGEGAMGTVYEAKQEQPRRTVALKVIKPGLASPELLRRFELEAQALGRLQHPGIAQIYEAGAADTGVGYQPYFAMEFIRGESLIAYVEARNLPLRQRLELMVKVCEAVHHAHQRGIIHRDLKPGNILVDESGQPKILDFGVARVTDSDTYATRETDVGRLVGTLAYMSPEQVLADPLELDTRSDVYALGVILFELLAGRLPYPVSRQLHETVRAIREQEPARLGLLNRACRGDIETIAAKALEKEKARRYSSAADLGDDIQRYLDDEPIVARPPTAAYQFRKFARRHRAVVAAAAAVFLVLIAGIIVSTREAARARHAEQTAVTESATANAINDFLQNDLLAQAGATAQARPGTKPDPDLKVRTALDRAAAQISGRFDRQPLVEAAIRQTIGNTYTDLGLFDEAERQLARAFDLRRRFSSPDDPGLLLTMNHLALVYLREAKFAEAEPLLQRVLEVRRRRLGAEHPDTLTAMDDLSELYFRLGNYAMAESLVVKVLETRRNKLGAENPQTLDAASNLAQIYQAQQRNDQAERLFLQVLVSQRRALGEEHPRTLSTVNNLALLYSDEGKLAKAEPLYTQVLAAQKRVLGEEHPYTLIAMNNLGTLYRTQGNYKKAEPLLQQVLAVRRRLLGPDHPYTLISLSNLALLFQKQGRRVEAADLFEKVVEGRRRVLGPENRATINSMILLGRLEIEQKEFRKAEELLGDALKAQQRSGLDNWDRYLGESTLGISLAAQGKSAEAEPLLLGGYQGLVERRAAIPWEYRSSPDEAAAALVQLYRKWGRPDKAAEWHGKLSSAQPLVAAEP